MQNLVNWFKSIPNTFLIWGYWRTKALHQVFYNRLWAQRIAYDLKLQADMAESNSKAVALEVASRLCKDTGVCASKSMGYGKTLSQEEMDKRIKAIEDTKETRIRERLISDLSREKANG